jgi:hypothetical protein
MTAIVPTAEAGSAIKIFVSAKLAAIVRRDMCAIPAHRWQVLAHETPSFPIVQQVKNVAQPLPKEPFAYQLAGVCDLWVKSAIRSTAACPD